MIIEPHFDYIEIDEKQVSAECPLYSTNISSIDSKGGKNGRWTIREHQLFVDALSRYGKSWKKVEDHIGTRSGAQIRSHAQKFFNRLEREHSKPFNGLKSGEIKEIFEDYEDVKLKRQKKLMPQISTQRKMEQGLLFPFSQITRCPRIPEPTDDDRVEQGILCSVRVNICDQQCKFMSVEYNILNTEIEICI